MQPVRPNSSKKTKATVAVGTIATCVLLLLPPGPPAFAQDACVPSDQMGGAAHTGPALVNDAGRTVVVNRQGERGLDAIAEDQGQPATATNRGAVITCGEMFEGRDDDGAPYVRRRPTRSLPSPATVTPPPSMSARRTMRTAV